MCERETSEGGEERGCEQERGRGHARGRDGKESDAMLLWRVLARKVHVRRSFLPFLYSYPPLHE